MAIWINNHSEKDGRQTLVIQSLRMDGFMEEEALTTDMLFYLLSQL